MYSEFSFNLSCLFEFENHSLPYYQCFNNIYAICVLLVLPFSPASSVHQSLMCLSWRASFLQMFPNLLMEVNLEGEGSLLDPKVTKFTW